MGFTQGQQRCGGIEDASGVACGDLNRVLGDRQAIGLAGCFRLNRHCDRGSIGTGQRVKAKAQRQGVDLLKRRVVGCKLAKGGGTTCGFPTGRLRDQPQSAVLGVSGPVRGRNTGWHRRQRHRPACRAQIGAKRQPRPVAWRKALFGIGHHQPCHPTRRNVGQRHLGVTRNRPQQGAARYDTRRHKVGTAEHRGGNGGIRADFAVNFRPDDAGLKGQFHGFGSSRSSATKS